VGSVLSIRKQYAEADRYFDIGISLAPDQPSAYVNKATNYLLWTGDTEKARSTLLKMPHTDDNTATFIRFLVEMCSRNYESALKVLTNEQSPQERSGFNAFLTGYVQDRLGRTREARRSYEEARVLLQKSIKERSDSPRVHVTFGFVLAVLGEKDEAIREGKLAASLFPVSKDALFGPDFVEYLAFIYTLVGEFDLAVETLEYLLSIPSRNLSVAMLRIDPRWDPLRDHPRFKKLVAP
jgi:serine/threonine-protein kinase